MKVHPLSVLFGVSIVILAGCVSQEEQDAKMHYDSRDLILPMQLKNDNLQVETDKLDIEIARLQGKRHSSVKLQIDEYAVETTEQTIAISNYIYRAISQPDKSEPPERRVKLLVVDKRLDRIAEACHTGTLAAKTLADAENACAELEAAGHLELKP
jgi:hypothetical protein